MILLRRTSVLALVLAIAACGVGRGVGGDQAVQAVVPEPVVAVDTSPPLSAEWYFGFPSSDSLAGFLRPGTGARLIVSAHRGGPASGFPENALETIENTLQSGSAFAEVDVRMTRDSALVLLHDETVDRTTTGSGRVASTTLSGVRELLLLDPDGAVTPFRVPTLAEALAWSEGRTVLMLDVKSGVPAVRVVDAIRRARAENRVVVIVYDLRDLVRYHQLAPDILLSASVQGVEELELAMEVGVELRRVTLFAGVGRFDPSLVRRARSLGMRVSLGTFGEIDARAVERGPAVFLDLLVDGIGMIATDQPALALDAVRRLSPR